MQTNMLSQGISQLLGTPVVDLILTQVHSLKQVEFIRNGF